MPTHAVYRSVSVQSLYSKCRFCSDRKKPGSTFPFDAHIFNSELNDTFVYGGDGNCKMNKTECTTYPGRRYYRENGSCEMTKAACTTYQGGLYDRSRSATAITGDTISHVGDNYPASWTYDTIKLSSHLSLPGFDFGMSKNTGIPWIAQGEIGLDAHSTF